MPLGCCPYHRCCANGPAGTTYYFVVWEPPARHGDAGALRPCIPIAINTADLSGARKGEISTHVYLFSINSTAGIYAPRKTITPTSHLKKVCLSLVLVYTHTSLERRRCWCTDPPPPLALPSSEHHTTPTSRSSLEASPPKGKGARGSGGSRGCRSTTTSGW